MGISSVAINLFAFGTLRDPELLRVVLGRDPETKPATLKNHTIRAVKNERFPTIEERAGSHADGILVTDISTDELDRLDFYEDLFGYGRVQIEVELGGDTQRAVFYISDCTYDLDGPWDLTEWQEHSGPVRREAAREIMFLHGKASAPEVAARMSVIETRAQARVRAADASPVKLRSEFRAKDVDVLDRRQPYSKFFTVDEVDLTYPQFAGPRSPKIERAIFVSADAVTVLPYDPVRDRVMLIEQFRAGPYLRGDPCPWSLEVIAGRVDAYETPEQAVRREAQEEAGLIIGDLHLAGRYYSSPGAKTEYLFSYITLADLPDGVDGVGGLDAEAEDIRSMLVSFDTLMEALDSGEAENGPLLISALWLARHRERLRG